MPDYKSPENINALRGAINNLCEEYREMLLSLAESPQTQKRSALIYYWLRDYKNYLKNEASFKCNYLPAYQRGNIVNINFGFNVGSELGGLHYAVVLTNSGRNNPNLIVAPMTSAKNRSTNKYEIEIGDALYQRVYGKHLGLRDSLKDRLSHMENNGIENDDTIQQILSRLDQLQKIGRKLQVLKHGSIINISQVRVVNKMRVTDPQHRLDVLYGITLSDKELDLIDEKLITHMTKPKKT